MLQSCNTLNADGLKRRLMFPELIRSTV